MSPNDFSFFSLDFSFFSFFIFAFYLHKMTFVFHFHFFIVFHCLVCGDKSLKSEKYSRSDTFFCFLGPGAVHFAKCIRMCQGFAQNAQATPIYVKQEAAQGDAGVQKASTMQEHATTQQLRTFQPLETMKKHSKGILASETHKHCFLQHFTL